MPTCLKIMDAKRNLEHLTRNTLPLQIRHSFIRRPWYHPVRTNLRFGVKPLHNTGLWTSTYLPGQSPCCEWLEFVVNEMYEYWINAWHYGYLYQPADGLKILEINTHEDLVAVNNVYGYVDEISEIVARDMNDPNFVHRWPDWGRIGRDFDAVHLTSNGQYLTRMPHYPYQWGSDNLYGWDAESTCWLRLHRRTLKYVGKIKLPYDRYTKQQLRDFRTLQKMRWEEAKKWMRQQEAKRTVDSFVEEHKIEVTDDERQALEDRAVQLLEDTQCH